MPQNIYDELKHEHAEMHSMMESLSKKFDQKAFDELAENLERHMEAEEDVLYSRLQDEEDVRPQVLEGIEEHRAATSILRRLQNIEGGSEVWDARLKVLSETVDHHVQEEETQLFPQAQKFISAEEAITLREQFEKAREQIHVHV